MKVKAYKNRLLKSADHSPFLTVANVFTVITKYKPYRKEINSNGALQVLQRTAENSALGFGIVSLLKQNFDEMNSVRMAAQKVSIEEYEQFSRNMR